MTLYESCPKATLLWQRNLPIKNMPYLQLIKFGHMTTCTIQMQTTTHLCTNYKETQQSCMGTM